MFDSTETSNNVARVQRITQRILNLGLIYSIGVSGIMSCFAYKLGNIICGSFEAGGYILILAPLIPIMYIDSSVDGILKGMGEECYCMVFNIIDALSSVIFV